MTFMGGVSNKDYITYYPGFGFDLLFKVTEVQNFTAGWHVSLLFDREV
jgi:hypothetical protein